MNAAGKILLVCPSIVATTEKDPTVSLLQPFNLGTSVAIRILLVFLYLYTSSPRSWLSLRITTEKKPVLHPFPAHRLGINVAGRMLLVSQSLLTKRGYYSILPRINHIRIQTVSTVLALTRLAESY